MYRLAAFDMDGTLLMRDHRIGGATLNALHQLVDNGMILTFATGRHCLDMKGILSHSGINGYLITGNGTRVCDMDGMHLDGMDLPAELVEFVLRTPGRPMPAFISSAMMAGLLITMIPRYWQPIKPAVSSSN